MDDDKKEEKLSDNTITIPLTNYQPARKRSIDEERKFNLTLNSKYVVVNKNSSD